jgi:small subunit ribosomal protein S10e
LVAKKDYNAPKHDDLAVPNLEVIKAMQSLTSRGYVKTQFSWQYYYYTLTPEGLTYLREWCAAIPSMNFHTFLISVLAQAPPSR